MNKRHTCDKCAHYTARDEYCDLMGDFNDEPNGPDRCAGWDYEGYRAGVYVGPKFGCIHWMKKEKETE